MVVLETPGQERGWKRFSIKVLLPLLVLGLRERAETKTRSQTSGRQHSKVEWIERDGEEGNK